MGLTIAQVVAKPISMARLTMRFHYFKNLDMCDRMTQSSHNFGQLFFLDFSITILVIQIEAVFEN
jgi:hypothetical protein